MLGSNAIAKHFLFLKKDFQGSSTALEITLLVCPWWKIKISKSSYYLEIQEVLGKKLQPIKSNLNLSWAGIWALPPRCPRFESRNSQNFLTTIFVSAVLAGFYANICSTKVTPEPITNTLMEATGCSNQHQLSLRWHTANWPMNVKWSFLRNFYPGVDRWRISLDDGPQISWWLRWWNLQVQN